MRIYNTGGVPGSTVTAQLLAPDSAGTAAESLQTLSTLADHTGMWTFSWPSELANQTQVQVTYGVSGSYWLITEPRSGSFDALTWNVVVKGAPGSMAIVTALPTTSALPTVSGNSTGTSIITGTGVPTVAGSLGQLYVRLDTPGTAGQRLYFCSTAGAAGVAVWSTSTA